MTPIFAAVMAASQERSPASDPADSLNTACFLFDSDEDSELPSGLYKTLVPETPSPQTLRRKRHCQKPEETTVAPASCSNGRNWDNCEPIPGYFNTTPVSMRTMKRRKLEQANSNMYNHSAPQADGFVMASTLVPPHFQWLESPRPTASSSAGSNTSALDLITVPSSENELRSMGCTSRQKNPTTSKTNGHGAKKPRTKGSRSKKAALPSPSRDQLVLLDTMKQTEEWPVRLPEEDVIIIEENADDMLRSVQMAEDEAYARSLQEQFDLEEHMDHQQQRQNRPPSTRDHYPMMDPCVGLSWIPPWAAMINSSSFSHSPSELQRLIFEEQPSAGRVEGRRRQAGRTRNDRRRHASRFQMDLFDDSQGNNYEALLAFEEQQGSVVAKNPLTEAQIELLPIKTYNPAHSADKTDCQICFSEYTAGEQLRMLPCLHDYHVKCIDRWLKENSTCPICRADITECEGFS